MPASEKRQLNIGRWIALSIFALIACWYIAMPRVVIYYSKDGIEEISYVLNTQHKIVRGDLLPGRTTGDVGHIFPNDSFFMMLDWWSDKGGSQCINITPKWPTTEIHLDRSGNIDISKGSGTDTDRLKQCTTDTAKP